MGNSALALLRSFFRTNLLSLGFSFSRKNLSKGFCDEYTDWGVAVQHENDRQLDATQVIVTIIKWAFSAQTEPS